MTIQIANIVIAPQTVVRHPRQQLDHRAVFRTGLFRLSVAELAHSEGLAAQDAVGVQVELEAQRDEEAAG